MIPVCGISYEQEIQTRKGKIISEKKGPGIWGVWIIGEVILFYT